MFPYFDIAHSLLCALSVKEDLGSGAHAFSRKHPLACWMSTMLVVFAGGMVASAVNIKYFLNRYQINKLNSFDSYLVNQS